MGHFGEGFATFAADADEGDFVAVGGKEVLCVLVADYQQAGTFVGGREFGDSGVCGEFVVLDAASEEGGYAFGTAVVGRGFHDEAFFAQRIVGGGVATQREPFGAEGLAREIIGPCEVAALLRVVTANHARTVDTQRNSVFALGDERPAVGAPADGHEECLAAEGLEVAGSGTAGKENREPVALWCLDEVGVTAAGDRIRAGRLEEPLGEDGVASGTKPGAADVVGTVDVGRVVVAGTSFGGKEVI